MKYSHIVSYVINTLWAIEPEKFNEILSVLAYRVAGHTFTSQEIAARIGSRSSRGDASTRGAVAVVPIHGTIAHRMGGMDESSGGTSTERIGAMMKAAASDPNVGTILLDIDSPGGTIPGVAELAADIRTIRESKKVVALANSLAASAAYWLAAQANEIVAIPSARVGSIGVYTAHQDLSKALEQEGVNVTLISAGKYKVEGNPFEPLSDEAKAEMQGRVDAVYSQFLADVAKGRGAKVADVRGGYGEGRALDAKDALAAGMIDRIATVEETLQRLVGTQAAAASADRYRSF